MNIIEKILLALLCPLAVIVCMALALVIIVFAPIFAIFSNDAWWEE